MRKRVWWMCIIYSKRISCCVWCRGVVSRGGGLLCSERSARGQAACAVALVLVLVFAVALVRLVLGTHVGSTSGSALAGCGGPVVVSGTLVCATPPLSVVAGYSAHENGVHVKTTPTIEGLPPATAAARRPPMHDECAAALKEELLHAPLSQWDGLSSENGGDFAGFQVCAWAACTRRAQQGVRRAPSADESHSLEFMNAVKFDGRLQHLGLRCGAYARGLFCAGRGPPPRLRDDAASSHGTACYSALCTCAARLDFPALAHDVLCTGQTNVGVVRTSKIGTRHVLFDDATRVAAVPAAAGDVGERLIEIRVTSYGSESVWLRNAGPRSSCAAAAAAAGNSSLVAVRDCTGRDFVGHAGGRAQSLCRATCFTFLLVLLTFAAAAVYAAAAETSVKISYLL